LASLRSLVVRPSSYVAKYQDQDVEPRLVGKELAVDAVLVWWISESRKQVSCHPATVDIATGEILWSDKIDVEYEDIIKIQDEISRSRSSTGLRLKITRGPNSATWLNAE